MKRLTSAEKELLAEIVRYVLETPCLEFVEMLDEKREKVAESLLRKL